MDQSIRGHKVPLPPTLDEVMVYLKRVLALPHVQKVEVTPSQIKVLRQVREGEPVVPSDLETEPLVDVADLVKKIQPEPYEFDPNEHPYFCLVGASRMITNKNLFVTHILAPQGEWLSAWMGLDYVPQDRERVLGMKVVYSNSELLTGKVVLLGSGNSAGLLTDALYGIIIDMNVPQ